MTLTLIDCLLLIVIIAGICHFLTTGWKKRDKKRRNNQNG